MMNEQSLDTIEGRISAMINGHVLVFDTGTKWRWDGEQFRLQHAASSEILDDFSCLTPPTIEAPAPTTARKRYDVTLTARADVIGSVEVSALNEEDARSLASGCEDVVWRYNGGVDAIDVVESSEV